MCNTAATSYTQTFVSISQATGFQNPLLWAPIIAASFPKLAPPPITGFSSRCGLKNSVTSYVLLRWTGSPAADFYNVYRNNSNAGFQFVQSVANATWLDLNQIPGTGGVYAVSAVSSGGGESARSSTSLCFTNPLPPSVFCEPWDETSASLGQ